MLFRQASVDVRPQPMPSEPVRFGGDAYQIPNGRKNPVRVLYKPVGQQALIAARQARKKKAEPAPLPEPEDTPSTWTYTTEMERGVSAPPANAYCDNSQPTSEAIEDALNKSAPSNARSYRGDSKRPPPCPPTIDVERTVVPTESNVSKPKVVAKPLSDGDRLEAEYAKNRAEDLERLMTPVPIMSTDVDAQFRSRSQSPQSSELQGPMLTPDQINTLTAQARKAQMKKKGVLRSGSAAKAEKPRGKNAADGATPQGRTVLGTSQRHVKIPSGQDKHRTDQRQAIAKRRENKRPLKSIEVTDELRKTTTTAALKEFKARGVTNTQRVLVLLMEFLSPSDGNGNEALFAYIRRRMLREEGEAPAKELEVNKKFLLNAAKKAISELTKSVKDMMNDDVCEDVTNDPEIRRRFGAGRRRSSLSRDILQIRQRVMEDGRVLHFFINGKKSGQQTLVGVTIDKS